MKTIKEKHPHIFTQIEFFRDRPKELLAYLSSILLWDYYEGDRRVATRTSREGFDKESFSELVKLHNKLSTRGGSLYGI